MTNNQKQIRIGADVGGTFTDVILTEKDIEQVKRCRRSHNRLGFGYQVGFVRLENRFPMQEPFEIDDELLTYTGVQLSLDTSEIHKYTLRQQILQRNTIGCLHG